jgi:hypothetical protein
MRRPARKRNRYLHWIQGPQYNAARLQLLR